MYLFSLYSTLRHIHIVNFFVFFFFFWKYAPSHDKHKIPGNFCLVLIFAQNKQPQNKRKFVHFENKYVLQYVGKSHNNENL